MKLFLSFLLMSSLSFSQDMTAITETGTWVVYHNWPEYGWSNECNCYTWYAEEDWTMYQSTGDTIINANIYQKLHAWPLYWDGAVFSSNWPAGGYHKLAYRNDDNLRAYRLMGGTSVEELWYDFNLQTGDTIEGQNQPAAFTNSTMYVYNTDSLELCDSIYKRFTYTNTPGQPSVIGYNFGVVQRVGCMANLIDDNWSGNSYYQLAYFCDAIVDVQDLHNILGVETLSLQDNEKELVKIVNLLGQETEHKPNTPLIYIYSDGSTERVYTVK